MLKLRIFKTGDEKIISTWVKEPKEFYLWTAGIMGDYPVTEQKILDAVSAREHDSKYFPFVAIDDDGIVGFFTMRPLGEDDKKVSFGYVIVDPKKRGLGIGKKMLELGLKFAFDDYEANEISIDVFDNNETAYKCYLKLDFHITGKQEIIEVGGYTWNYLEMIKKR